MATAAVDLDTRVHYLNANYGIKSWLLTTDHKRIAILYLASITFFFLVGGIAAVLMRIHLIEPNGAIFEPATYNKLFSMHGIIMVFFFLIPSIPAVLGNFLVPMMIGARDLAFPKLNLLSWYVFMVGGILTLYAVIWGGVDTGWTFYTPLSTTYLNTNVMSAALGVFVAGFSSILTGLNFVVTIHKMRAPGMTWFRMPLFLWAMYATSLIQILGTPVLAITLALVAVERLFHVGIFDPAVGGDPILFQHLFWFYSHPAVYIMILPSMGVVSELIACFAKKRIFGYSFVAFSSVAIAVISFLVWGHHMFVSGQSIYAGIIFSALSFAGGDSFRHQGVQLDGHALQGFHFLPGAHALRPGLHRPVHHGRVDGPLPGDAGRGHPRPRHLLRGRPLPLHHGGRRGDGVPGRHSFLVAQNHRAALSRRLGAPGRGDHLYRF